MATKKVTDPSQEDLDFLNEQEETEASGNESDDKVFDVNNLPEDFTVNTSQTVTYDPIKAGMYQVQVLDIVIKENPFYKPDAKKPEDRGNKYQISATLVVLKEGENYGRRIWDNLAPVVKPTGKKGATKAYKFITAVLGTELDWDGCASFAPSPKEFYENLLTLKGKQLLVTVEVSTSEAGKKRNKIVSYLPVDAMLPPFDESKIKKQ